MHPSLRFVFVSTVLSSGNCDNNFLLSLLSVMVAPATEPEGMVVGDGAEQADASTNTVGILRSS